MNPATIGGYEILGELGRGAMGVVYHGRDSGIGRPVAIKVIRVDAGTSFKEGADLRQRLIREASVAGKIYHPGIVTVHQLGEEDDKVFIVMEFVDGSSLEHLLSNNPALDRAWVLDILAQIAVALDYAHKSGVVHRDIKPANILVRSDGRVKIADFGIAKIAASAATGMTGAGVSIGSPAYMSPEQIQASEIDGRSDQFALGTIAFQMLAGRMPFKGTTAHTLMFQIVMADPFEPQPGDVPVSPEVRAVLSRALAKNPRDRFPDCASFIQALTGAQVPRPSAPAVSTAKFEPVAALAPVPKPSKSWMFAPIAGAVMTVALVSGGVYWYIRHTCCTPPPAQPTVKPPAEVASTKPAPEPVVTPPPEAPPADPKLVSEAPPLKNPPVRPGSVAKKPQPVATAPYEAMTLLAAVTQGKLDAVKSALAKGANINEPQADGTTALMAAAEAASPQANNLPIVKALIDGRAALEARDSLGRTALHRAAAAGKTEIAGVLLDSGALINTKSHDGTTPLLYAVEFGKLPTVQALVARHAQLDIADTSGTTPLMAASEGNIYLPVSKPFVEALLAGGAHVDLADVRGRTALYRSAAAGKPEAARELLDRGAKPNLRASDKTTALIAAVSLDRPVVVEVLLGHGADANLADATGSTPLMIAAETSPGIHDPEHLIKLLLDHGAKRGLKDSQGRTAFQRAAESKNTAAIGLLK